MVKCVSKNENLFRVMPLLLILYISNDADVMVYGVVHSYLQNNKSIDFSRISNFYEDNSVSWDGQQATAQKTCNIGFFIEKNSHRHRCVHLQKR